MKPEEERQLLVDVAVIKNIVSHLHDEHVAMKQGIDKNSKFRVMILGFVLIGMPLVGLAARYL